MERNEEKRDNRSRTDVEADSLKKSLLAEGRERKDANKRTNNKLWLWFGILILLFIVIYILWAFGLFEGFTN